EVYRNDDTPLAVKFSEVTRLLVHQVNLFDLVAAAGAGLATAVSGLVLAGWHGLRSRLHRRTIPASPRRLDAEDAPSARQTVDLTASVIRHREELQAGIDGVVQRPPRSRPIHLLWPWSLPQKNAVAGEGLWHVCPTGVFACHTGPLGQATVQIHAAKC